MDLQADAVPQPMDELVAVSGSGDDIAGEIIDLFPDHSTANTRQYGVLRVQHDIVNRLERESGIAEADRARQVGGVPLPERAHIDDNRLSREDLPRASRVMRSRGVRTGGDDRPESRSGRSEPAHGVLDASLQLDFGHPLIEFGDPFEQRRVGKRSGLRQDFDLISVLDDAQSGNGRLQRGQCPRTIRPRFDLREVADRQRFFLESCFADSSGREHIGNVDCPGITLTDDFPARSLFARPIDVVLARNEHCAIDRDHEDARGFVRRMILGRVPGEITSRIRVRNDERVNVALGENAPGAIQPGVSHSVDPLPRNVVAGTRGRTRTRVRRVRRFARKRWAR